MGKADGAGRLPLFFCKVGSGQDGHPNNQTSMGGLPYPPPVPLYSVAFQSPSTTVAGVQKQQPLRRHAAARGAQRGRACKPCGKSGTSPPSRIF